MSNHHQDQTQTVISLAQHMARLKQAASSFAESNTVRTRGYFSPSEDDQVVQLWISYHMARSALLELIADYKQANATSDAIQPFDFARTFAGAVILVDAGMLLRRLFADQPVIRRKLNESYQLYGVPAGSFDAIQMSLSDPMHAIQLYQANQFYDEHLAQFQQQATTDNTLQSILAIIDQHRECLQVSKRAYAKARAHDRGKDLYDSIVRGGFGKAIYAIQSWVSRCVGQLTTQPGHQPALPEPIKSELLKKLQPGDVLATRKEHSLTNYFLPGYWPHVALYIGAGKVIEALADGVHERSVDSPFAVDAIAAIRSQLAAEQIDEVIERARSHVGKPYDFDFDFTRADRMVCTEVVYRGYEGIGNIKFNLTRRAGRETLSAEDLLNLARRSQHFQKVAVYCPLHGNTLLEGESMESVLAKTVCS